MHFQCRACAPALPLQYDRHSPSPMRKATLDVIDQWTGRHACALQFALRMTHDDLAAALGVARRTVASWHEKPTLILRPELQRALDTLYGRAAEGDKIRFARQLRTHDRSDAPPSSPTDVAPLTVALAVVVSANEVLIVRRNDPDPSGITWQFPAGVVKPGATAATIAVRETLAETGVHCSVLRSLGSRVHPMSHAYCEYFLCQYLAGTVENRDVNENMAAIFVARQDITRFIPSQNIYPPILQALENLGDSVDQ
jgi:8-oxo-dGTP diphosphatase